MTETADLFIMQIFLLCLILTGFITVKVRIVDIHTRSAITNLILNVFLPCNILSSFFGTDRSRLPSMGIVLLISLGTLLFSFVLAQVLYPKAGKEQKKVLLYATLISNASFLGNPIVESVYGIEAIPYAAVYLVPLRVALWTVGLAVFAGGKGNLKKVLFHPCLIATYIGLAVAAAGAAPPFLVSRLALTLGNCTTPLAMMIVGCVLGMMDLKKLFTPLALYFSFIRLFLIPALVMAAMLALRVEPVIAGVSVVLSGTPAGVTTTILAEKYGADKDLSSRIVFISTLFSIVTIPLLVGVVLKLY